MKKAFIKKATAILLTAVMLTSFAGCQSKKSASDVSFGDTYPLKTDQTLSWWSHWTTSSDYASYQEQPFYKELQERLGVKINFKLNQTEESFNLLLASNDMPDIIQYKWGMLSNSPDFYIGNGQILDITDLIDKYAPNFKAYLEENPDIARQCKTDSGKYYGFPFIRGDKFLTVFNGLIARKDLMDKYGIKTPTTVDEFTEMLKTFKKNGIATPLSLTSGTRICNAFDTEKGFYIDNGKVKYGYLENGYKEYIKTMNQWYSEGLLDKDYGAITGSVLNGKMASGTAVVTAGNAGNGIGTWLPAGRKSNPEYELQAIPYLTTKKGEKPEHGQGGMMGTIESTCVISSKCKNPELAVKILDYGYSKEGRMFYNFGTENESYKMENGQPKFTTLITDYPNQDMTASLSRYIGLTSFGPSIQDVRMQYQRLAYPEQIDAIKVWMNTNEEKHLIPAIMQTTEESETINPIMNNVQSFVDENEVKFILGQRPMSELDSFIDTIKQYGIEDVIKLKQDAYNRYMKR